MHVWHLRIRASSLQFRASKINMALARMDKLVKKLMSNPAQSFDPVSYFGKPLNNTQKKKQFLVDTLSVILAKYKDVAQETAANYLTLKIIILTLSIKRWKRVSPDIYLFIYLFIYSFNFL